MRAGGIGTVIRVAEGVTKAKVGDVLSGMVGWTDYTELDVDKAQNPTSLYSTKDDYLESLGGIVSLTAYFGIMEVGKVKLGETVVVSGAAGAAGSAVVQLARIFGAGKVVGITSGQDKCLYVEKELGADKYLDYKSPEFENTFAREVGLLDIYFDNVGEDILDLALRHLNKYARVVLCGSIATYNQVQPKGIRNYNQLTRQSATAGGFIVFDYASRFGEALGALRKWTQEGKLKRMKFHVEQGLESCPDHLKTIFSGVNMGKMIVNISSIDPGLI
ncbi:hypothetical protein FRB93_009703 [Tulasnella sp. JGI-2019a]|nr:hypothetical protein FRB93_009703 [Tulasnella sp. JGI-2019a]